MKALADWREPSNYPTVRPISKDDDWWRSWWAWNFLRRNPQYRMAYDLHRGQRSRDAKIEASRFSLAFFLPYRDASPEFVPFLHVDDVRLLATQEARQLSISLDEKQVAVIIRLDRPLKVQLALAEGRISDHLDDLKRSSLRRSETGANDARPFKKKWSPNALLPARNHYPTLARYLRVLDALDDGASPRAIACQFLLERVYYPIDAIEAFEGQKKVETDIRRAKKNRDHDYLRLAVPPVSKIENKRRAT